jgi:hypothetical protein
VPFSWWSYYSNDPKLKQISDLNKTIDAGLIEVEILCDEAAINQATSDFFKVRQARASKEDRERELKALAETSGPSGHQKLQVCDVCGAYLSRLDNDRRLADHFYGKMHLGYAQMRKTFEVLQKELKGRAPPPRAPEEERARGDPDGYAGERGYGRQGGGYRGRGGGRGGFGRRW